MHIALVDDEQLQLQMLTEMLTAALGRLGLEAEVDRFCDAEAFFAAFETDKYDIIILDIYMGGITGIDVARRIRQVDAQVTLAFCTSSNEFASQSYEVNARDYLQKPISEEKIMAMLNRFQLSKIERNRSIRLPDGFRVHLRHIIYTEYINHSVQFHIAGQEPHTVRASHGDIEAILLAHKGFCVINKGCIVNFAQVRSITSNAFVMQNGETVPIARRRYKEIEAAYTQYIFDKMREEVSG